MTARQTTAGTCGDGFRCDDPPPIPRPRNSSEPRESCGDPREPGRRAEPKERQR